MAWTERGGGTVAVNTVVYQTPTADQVIQPGSDVTGLIVKGFAGGAANPFEVWDGAATPALASYGNSAGNWLLRNSLVLVRAGGNLTLTAANPAASRTYTIPDALANDSFAFLTAAQTLTNKTLTSPVVNGGTFNTVTLVVPVIGDLSSATHNHSSDAEAGSTLTGLVLNSSTCNTCTFTAPVIGSTAFTSAQHPHTGASSGGALAIQAIPGTFQTDTGTANTTTTSTTYVEDTDLTLTVVDPGYNYVLEVCLDVLLGTNAASSFNVYENMTVGVDGVAQNTVIEKFARSLVGSNDGIDNITSSLVVFFNITGGASRTIRPMFKISNASYTAYSGGGLFKSIQARIVGRQ